MYKIEKEIAKRYSDAQQISTVKIKKLDKVNVKVIIDVTLLYYKVLPLFRKRQKH